MKFISPIIVVIVVIVLGALLYTSTQKPQPSDSMMESEGAMTEEGGVNGENGDEDSRYLVYSKSNLDAAKDTRRVLFFYANWCPTCRPADASFSQNESKIPSDVTVIRVNYNDTDTDQEEKALAAKYGVTYQHTYVQIDEDGAEVTKWNGGRIDELLQRIR